MVHIVLQCWDLLAYSHHLQNVINAVYGCVLEMCVRFTVKICILFTCFVFLYIKESFFHYL